MTDHELEALALLTLALWPAFAVLLWATRPRKPAIDLTPHMPALVARRRGQTLRRRTVLRAP